ncbi:protein NLP6-like isoform X2 [Salvia hispanica]|uniref:protein NLP6-like isoform X2 n=1 Tax=Salvia hispanica TaxID=49212 RepID=UPI00200972B1|nr:protein NLP6-like isoform X2 [Salvia hispanica]
MEDLQTQSLSLPEFTNLMAPNPLSYSSHSDWHVFSGDRQESEFTKPTSNFSNSITKIKIKAALELFDFICFPSLVQFWSPTISQDQQELLHSSDLPFALRGLRKGICLFRKRCSDHRYNVRGDRCGPPGRVFRRRFPEFCPDLRCYSEEEFELKDLAMAAGIRGYLCLPVFEPDWNFCIGVVEILTIMDGSFYFANVIDKVSASLKEVGLRCSDAFWPFDTNQLTYNQLENGPGQYKLAVDEIQNVLDVLCKAYKLPFAQTWVAIRGGANEESFISTAKMESVTRFSSFQRDCNWFHLRKGQGIVWKALSSGACFCRDVTKLSLVDYALALSARKVGFTGGFAICLQSTYPRNLQYIIELFLPPNQTIYQQPRIFLTSLLDTMKQEFKTFKLRTGQDVHVEVLQTSEDDPLDSFVMSKTMHASESLENQANKAQRTPAVPLPIDNRANSCRPETVRIGENTASSSLVSKCCHNEKAVPSHDTTPNNTRDELNPQRIFRARIGSTRKLSLGEVVSTKAPQNLSENRVDNLNSKRSISNNMKAASGINGRKRSRVGCSAEKHIVETIQQCRVSPPDEGHSSHSSLSPYMENLGCIMTVKADFEGDTIMFKVPADSGITKLKDEVVEMLKLDGATFELKYQREDKIWVVLDTDAKLLECVSGFTSSGLNKIRLSIMSIKMTVKASYKDDLIKFELPLSAGILELKNEMINMLKLNDGSFEIKYTDENNSPISLDSDKALQNCINTAKALKKTTIRLSIQPIVPQTSTSNECIAIVKATYGGDIIKFKFTASSGIMKLKDEMSKMLTIETASFVVKYPDECGNEVAVDGDAALTDYMTRMASFGTVRISLQRIDQPA